MAQQRSKTPPVSPDAEQVRQRSKSEQPAVGAQESLPVGERPSLNAEERHAAMLGDFRLDYSANAVRRADIAQYVQRTYGNEHRQRVIQRVRGQRVLGKRLGTGLSLLPLRSNPFGPAEEEQITASGLRPNPFGPAVEQEAGTPPVSEPAIKSGGLLRPNPFVEQEAATPSPAGGPGLTPSGLRPNPFGPAVEQEGGAQTPTARSGGFSPDAAARIRLEIMTPIEQAAEEALTASPPDTQRAMRLIGQAIRATASAPFEQRFARSTAATMRHEVMTPLEEAGELLASGGSVERAMALLGCAIGAAGSLQLERGAR